MKKFILAKKLNMTQVWTEDGKVVPVTVLEAGPCRVMLIRVMEKDKYQAVQIELGKKRREFRTTEEKYEVGQEIKASDFKPGELVNIIGTSKGRGFTGAVKRHGFHGAPASHGHDHPRAVGSIGQRFPQHVRPGLRMAGRLGGSQATITNSVILEINPERNLLLVKGGVPGARRSLVQIVTTGRTKDLPRIKEYAK